ncbi:hypothetical protein M233_00475 [Xylella fastidiosa subsp. multiplex Griffin-1]|nr:hypothetical protein M233_00475 [Xylella fastidiosa subsp. multiplex Griffin-1]
MLQELRYTSPHDPIMVMLRREGWAMPPRFRRFIN